MTCDLCGESCGEWWTTVFGMQVCEGCWKSEDVQKEEAEELERLERQDALLADALGL